MLSNQQRDNLFSFALRFLAMTSAGIVILIVTFVARESMTAFDTGGNDAPEPSFHLGNLFSDESWNPTAGQFDLRPMIIGSLLVTLTSTLLTAPIGIGVALFLNFYAPQRIGYLFRRVVEVMAGVPSVVYGLWGLSVLVPLIASISPIEQGQSLLAGALTLTLMTIPTVVIACDAAIAAVPNSQIRAAAALGISTRATVWSIVIPTARFGLFSAVILQIGRAVGETMAVLMVCGNIVQTPGSIFDPVRTLTANIALEMGYADNEHRAVLFLSGLIGLILVIILMMIANTFSQQRTAKT